MTREEAIKELRGFIGQLTEGCQEAIKVLIPELAESEDERIRKELKEAFEAYDIDSKWNGIPIRSIFAWLEKQKEKSEIPIMDGDTDTYFDDLRMTTKPLTSREWFDEGIKYAQRLQKEQKPAWSEEDKRKLNRIYSIIGWAMDEHAFSSCKKLLGDKEGVELQDFLRSIAKPKPEWSKEDEEMRNALWNLLKIQYPQDYYMTGAGIKAGKFRDWLKSLRPSWKPSEEQMEALEAATVRYQSTGLESLYEDLKKL